MGNMRSIAFICFSVVGPLVLFWAAYNLGVERASFPDREALQCSALTVSNVEVGEYGATVNIRWQAAKFHYSKKSGDFDAVVRAMSSRAEPLGLCFVRRVTDRNSGFEIFEVKSGGRTLRSLSQVRGSWEREQLFLWALIPMTLVASTYLAFRAGQYSRAIN